MKKRLNKSSLRAIGPRTAGETPLQWPAARKHPAPALAAARLKKWGLVTLAVAGLAAMAALAVFRLPWRMVTRVEVTGARYVDEQVVIDSARVRVGSPLYDVDMDSVGARVLGITWVHALEVTRNFSGVIEIRIEEREPVGLVVGQSGTFLVDAESVLQPLGDKLPPDVPLVTGLGPEGPDHRKRLNHAATLLAEIANISPLDAVVSEIHDARPGMTVLLLSPKGTPVLLPRTVGRDRLVNVASVVQQNPGVLLDAHYLDARFAGRVAAKS